VSTSTKIFAIAAVVLLITAAWRQHRIETGRAVIFTEPVSLHTGDTFARTFTVDRAASYYLEIECERTPESIEGSNDLDDALRDGLDVDVRVTASGVPVKVNVSEPEHSMWGQGFYSRVLATFNAKPVKTYNLALHIDRYGQGLSARDHKLAGTWDENLIIPEDAHPKLKMEIDPHHHETDGISQLLLWIVCGICLIPPLKFWLSRCWHRTRRASNQAMQPTAGRSVE
jgi:hypothetical protein